MIDDRRAAGAGLPAFAPEMLADPKVSLFRQFRDTRFSEDKTPLKTHIGADVSNRALGRMNGAGLYFEVAPAWVWIGGGLCAPDTSQLHTGPRAHRRATIASSTRS